LVLAADPGRCGRVRALPPPLRLIRSASAGSPMTVEPDSADDLTVSTSAILIVLGTFLASAVELVEALTIVLGVGTVRGWRSTLIGVGAACIVLAVLVAALGPALDRIPISSLRLVVGALLLAFGLQWLRKAILRSSGHKALHDEDEAFRHEREQAAA